MHLSKETDYERRGFVKAAKRIRRKHGMASVTLKHVYKIYDGGVQAVSDFNLEIADKEFIILVGPSGCGKIHPLRTRGAGYQKTENQINTQTRGFAAFSAGAGPAARGPTWQSHNEGENFSVLFYTLLKRIATRKRKNS